MGTANPGLPGKNVKIEVMKQCRCSVVVSNWVVNRTVKLAR